MLGSRLSLTEAASLQCTECRPGRWRGLWAPGRRQLGQGPLQPEHCLSVSEMGGHQVQETNRPETWVSQISPLSQVLLEFCYRPGALPGPGDPGERNPREQLKPITTDFKGEWITVQPVGGRQRYYFIESDVKRQGYRNSNQGLPHARQALSSGRLFFLS